MSILHAVSNRVNLFWIPGSVLAAVRRRGYEKAPLSRLLLEGKEPAYEYQRDLNAVAKRRHLSIHCREERYLGRPVWIASATHDIDIGAERAGTRWYHSAA